MDTCKRDLIGMVNELDKSVGNVVKALSKKGILNNTIIIFFSDNGAQTEGLYENFGSNWPLRGLKFSLHDGGIKTAAVLYSSLLQDKGLVNNELIHISDLMPTLYAAAGGNVENLGKIDGLNQWPSLTTGSQSPRANLLLNIDEVKDSSGVIGENGRYKLINGSTTSENYDNFFGETGRDDSSPPYNIAEVLDSEVNIALGQVLTLEKIQQIRSDADLGNCRNSEIEYTTCSCNKFCLFDLFKDPCETTNLAEDFPEIVDILRDELQNYWKQLETQKNTFVDPNANPILFNNTWYTWLDDKFLLKDVASEIDAHTKCY